MVQKFELVKLYFFLITLILFLEKKIKAKSKLIYISFFIIILNHDIRLAFFEI